MQSLSVNLLVSTGSLSTFLKILNKESNGNWIVEEILIDKIANQIVEFLIIESFIEINQTFKELKIIDISEEEIVEEAKESNDTFEKIGYNILLVKKLIFNNKSELDRLV